MRRSPQAPLGETRPPPPAADRFGRAETMIDIDKHLNPSQFEAVEAVDGPILVLAGAGSGKTRVITYRIAHLIENRRVRPESILAVTFTNKAADQMKFRMRRLLGPDRPAEPVISTFHSLCVRLLRREIEVLAYTRDFTIYDADDQRRVIKASMKALTIEDRVASARSIQARISHAKNHGKSPAQVLGDAWEPSWEATGRVFEDYEKRLRGANALDFDDLLIRTGELFDRFPNLAERYSDRFRYIMIDEYQDTNRMQYLLMRHLTRLHDNVCVVGDEDQSIYSWRGADIQNILSFEKDYPRARIIKLEQNYRSTKNILAAAGAVVRRNELRKGKELWTRKDAGERITLFGSGDAEQEAAFVAQAASEHLEAKPESRIAVLYRTNFLSRVFEEVFRRSNIAYQIVGGLSFYERAEVRDMTSYLTVALNPDDSVHLLRIINTPPRGIGKTTTDALEEIAIERSTSIWGAIGFVIDEGRSPIRTLRALEAFRQMAGGFVEAADELSSPELLERILGETGYIESLKREGTEEALSRTENLRELMTAAAESSERGERLRDFLDHAALVSDQDAYNEKAPVTLMTVHTAKGLEFSVVFIAGLEDGLFPHSRSILESASLEEERRLFYVAMTRAEEKLYLTSARYRRYFGNMEQQASEASRFLAEIPQELMELYNRPEKQKVAFDGPTYNSVEAVTEFLEASGKVPPRMRAGAAARPAHTWSLGTRVKHPKYGYGTVLRTEGSGDDLKLTISFTAYGLKKIMARYTKLEPV